MSLEGLPPPVPTSDSMGVKTWGCGAESPLVSVIWDVGLWINNFPVKNCGMKIFIKQQQKYTKNSAKSMV